jgi:hypothetical protein
VLKRTRGHSLCWLWVGPAVRAPCCRDAGDPARRGAILAAAAIAVSGADNRRWCTRRRCAGVVAVYWSLRAPGHHREPRHAGADARRCARSARAEYSAFVEASTGSVMPTCNNTQICNVTLGSLTYRPHPTRVVVGNTVAAWPEKEDSAAAYTHALLWFITQDVRHAAKSVEIMDAWATTFRDQADRLASRLGWSLGGRAPYGHGPRRSSSTRRRPHSGPTPALRRLSAC